MRLGPRVNITRVLSFTPPAAPQRIKAKLSDRRVVAEGNSTSALTKKNPVLPNIHRAAAEIHVVRESCLHFRTNTKIDFSSCHLSLTSA